ncbi:alginate O-acetyltransferase AlgX-related protein [Acidiluteibacter ferrifornacis]|uniref:AlgX/AlgJ SGNH hydrolase-like domain-containing protein n=1 Tax=Acidiluteibacter ferrifornacis TaxID=2692424 RepID=A0A6N9NJP4_9FLAO|nr:hypothetical protein [Acidiluteibacter ferrifornacis]NBG66908.1 hypothetical protein [Acidiluteibacter ferrifornacis]
MGKQQQIKIVLFAGVILFLFVFRIQGKFKIFEKGYLNGYYTYTAKPELTVDSWMSGDYQEKRQRYVEENIGFRNYLIRLYNQFAFTFFHVARANGVTIGKEDYLYEEQYIRSYLGTDFIGEDRIIEKVDKLKMIKDQLNLEGIELLTVIAPGKGFYYPEYLPDKRLKEKKDSTNYQVYVETLKQQSIPLIDVNGWFLKMKDTTTYPLYPKGGTHWTNYGEILVADSIRRFVQDMLQIPFPKIVVDSIEWSDTARFSDNDIELGMNLLFHLKPFPMAYPKFRFDFEGVNQRTKVLTIGDSYYWGMFGHEITDYVFNNSQFWYYNRSIHQPGKEERKVSEVNKMAEIRKHKVVMLLFTEGNLMHFAYDFIEELYAYYSLHPNTERELKLIEIEQSIKLTPEWLESVTEDALKKGISLDENIRSHAEYVLYMQENELEN